MKAHNDRWVAVSLDVFVPKASSHPATINDQALAVWRADTGPVQVWADRCPHRGMRLSFGFVDGEKLRCSYHGWGYDQDGVCVSIPAHPSLRPPKTICASTFLSQTRYGIVWTNLAENPSADMPQLEDSLEWVPVRSVFISAPTARLDKVLRTFDFQAGPYTLNQIGGDYLLAFESGMTMFIAVQDVAAERIALHVVMAGGASNSNLSQTIMARRLVALRSVVEHADEAAP